MRAPLVPPHIEKWTAEDGVELHARCWTGKHPVGVIILHGIQSHGGWYEWSASLLASQGNPVVMPDRRGSGLSGGKRGHAGRSEQWLSDIETIVSAARESLGFERYALVGISWGGKIVAEWCRRRPDEVLSALLVTPGVFPGVGVSMLEKLRIAADLIRRPTADHDIPLSDSALFTDNPAGQQFIDADPLKLTQASASFLYQSARLDARIRRWPAGAFTVPSTMLLAEDERIIDNVATQRWFERVAARGRIRTLVGRHTLEFAEDPSKFRHELVTWRDELNAGLSGKAKTAE